MADDNAPLGAEATHSGVVSLRRELWRKHVQLRSTGPDDLRYAGAATEALDLTERLLAAEDAVAASVRAAHRRTMVGRYVLAVGCSAVLIIALTVLPVPATMITRTAVGAALVLIVLTAAALVRRRRSPATSANPRVSQPATEAVTAPLTAPEPPSTRSSS